MTDLTDPDLMEDPEELIQAARGHLFVALANLDALRRALQGEEELPPPGSCNVVLFSARPAGQARNPRSTRRPRQQGPFRGRK